MFNKTISLSLIMTLLGATTFAQELSKHPIVAGTLPGYHEKVGCDTHQFAVRFYTNVEKERFTDKSFYILDNNKKIYGDVSIEEQVVMLKLHQNLPCDTKLIAHIEGVNFNNRLNTLQWVFETNSKEPFKKTPPLENDEKSEYYKGLHEHMLAKQSAVAQQTTRSTTKEEQISSQNKTQPQASVIENRWFILPSLGLAMTKMDSSWNVTPAPKDEVAAQKTNYFSLKAGQEKNTYRYFVEADYVKWSDAQTVYLLVGADYIIRDVLRDFTLYGGVKAGYARFSYDEIDAKPSGGSYGIGLGASKIFYGYQVELLYSYMVNSLEAKDTKAAYTHTVTQEDQHLLGLGVKF